MHGEGLVFAGGAPRSGLTLLRAIANAHPDIFCGPDTNATPALALQQQDFAHHLGALHRDHFSLPSERVRNNFCTLINNLFESALRASGKSLLIEKSALNIIAFEALSEILPKAKFIHVVRDGRDVAASLLARDWRAWRDPSSGVPFSYVTDAGAAASYWAGLAGAGYNAEKKINNANRVITLRYEAIVSAPAKELERLCQFLNIPYAPEMLNFQHQDIDLFGIERDSADMLKRPLTSEKIGRYKTDLTAAQLDKILQPSKPVLSAFGYC